MSNRIIVLFLFSIQFVNLFGQKTITGRILEDGLEPLSGAFIFGSDTTEIGRADLNGYFELTIPDETNELIFGFVGCEFRTVSFIDSCRYFEVILLLSGTYNIKSHRKLDRLRKKEYNKLTELHRRAFNEGKFIYEDICYTSEFIPDKPALDIIRKELIEFRKVNKTDFKQLNIGDIVKVPFGIDTAKNENIVRTHYSPCRNCTEDDYDYIIEGVVFNKHRRKLTLEIKITKMSPYDFLKYRGSILNIGSVFKYKMKYFEVIIDKNSNQHKNK